MISLIYHYQTMYDELYVIILRARTYIWNIKVCSESFKIFKFYTNAMKMVRASYKTLYHSIKKY